MTFSEKVSEALRAFADFVAEVNRENVNHRWICLDVTFSEKVSEGLRPFADFVAEVNPENANSNPIANRELSQLFVNYQGDSLAKVLYSINKASSTL